MFYEYVVGFVLGAKDTNTEPHEDFTCKNSSSASRLGKEKDMSTDSAWKSLFCKSDQTSVLQKCVANLEKPFSNPHIIRDTRYYKFGQNIETLNR